MSNPEAQKRADRIRSFRDELRQIEAEEILLLTDAQRERLSRYHDQTLRDLAGRFDVDTTDAQKQMSWGMRIASFLGALALCAAVFLFFRRFWGLLSTPTQVAVLLAAPILGLLGTHLAARRDRTLYFASILGLVAFGCFVLDLMMLGDIFNITPSPKAFLPWAAFGFLLAYTYGPRILLAAGILALSGWLSATTGTWSGCYWLSFGARPENFLVAGAVLLPILVLANWGDTSYLMLAHKAVESFYQIAGFVVAGLAIAFGIRRGFREVTNLGCTFFVIDLYTKFFDWWWDWMPKYLFFLILGGVAVGLLLLLKRLRALSLGARPE